MKVFMDCFDFVGKAVEKKLPDFKFTYFFTSSNNTFNFVNDFFEVRKKLISGELNSYDIIHINNWFNFLLIKYRRPGQVWIAESHGFHLGLNFRKALADSTFLSRIIGILLGIFFHFPIKRAIKKFDYYFAAIPNILDDVRVVRKDAIWLSNPIDDSFFKNPKKKRFDGSPSIFFPTRLHKMKEPELGFKIFESVLQKFPKAKLHLIRYPERYSQYQYYSKYTDRLKDKIVWHDFFDRKNIVNIYPSFDLVFGAFGKGLLNLVELEAMASGATVVSYDKYELIKEDKEHLSDFTMKLLRDRNFKRRYTERCRKYVREAHSADNIAKKYRNLILEKMQY